MTTTHSMDATLECSALLMTGTATLTTLPSRADMNVPTPTAASTHQAPGGTVAGVAGGAGLWSSGEFVNGGFLTPIPSTATLPDYHQHYHQEYAWKHDLPCQRHSRR